MVDYNIVVSIVAYQNDDDILRRCIDSILNTGLKTKLYIIDNSPTDKTRNLCCSSRIDYVFNNANIGFAAGPRA